MLTRAKGKVKSRLGAAAAAVPGRFTAHEALELLVRRAHRGTVVEKRLVVSMVAVRRARADGRGSFRGTGPGVVRLEHQSTRRSS